MVNILVIAAPPQCGFAVLPWIASGFALVWLWTWTSRGKRCQTRGNDNWLCKQFKVPCLSTSSWFQSQKRINMTHLTVPSIVMTLTPRHSRACWNSVTSLCKYSCKSRGTHNSRHLRLYTRYTKTAAASGCFYALWPELSLSVAILVQPSP